MSIERIKFKLVKEGFDEHTVTSMEGKDAMEAYVKLIRLQ